MRKKHYKKTLFPSRERCFSLRRIRGILAIRRRACSVTSERHIGELGVRSLSALNRGQDSKQQSHIAHRSDQYRFAFGPILVDVKTTIGSLVDHYWFVCCTTIGSPSKRIVVYILHLFYLVYALLLVANLPA